MRFAMLALDTAVTIPLLVYKFRLIFGRVFKGQMEVSNVFMGEIIVRHSIKVAILIGTVA
jgi:hypothetical protein